MFYIVRKDLQELQDRSNQARSHFLARDRDRRAILAPFKSISIADTPPIDLN